MPPKKKDINTVVLSDSSVSTSNDSSADKKKSTSVSSTTTVKVNHSDSDRLQLAQAINNLVVRGETFAAALDELSNFSKERLVELDLKIEAKKSEFQDLTNKLENQYKDTEIKLRQSLQETKLVAAKEVLSGLDMTAVTNSEYSNVTSELASLKAQYKTDIEKAIRDEQDKAKSQLTQVLMNKELAHAAEIATLKATTEQQIKEINVLKETIKNLKEEIAEQRTLTKEVAIASSKGAIQQSFGSK